MRLMSVLVVVLAMSFCVAMVAGSIIVINMGHMINECRAGK